uniref:Uncharacterized protein n=1 Tax=Aegilops tauschii subsp. strangulata TaxID=200361 RepID=A0A453HZW3_AEGTS
MSLNFNIILKFVLIVWCLLVYYIWSKYVLQGLNIKCAQKSPCKKKKLKKGREKKILDAGQN